MNIFITGESGTIPKAMQNDELLKIFNFKIINHQQHDPFKIKTLKTHKSFKVREPELDFLNKELLFSKEMEKVWENTDVIIHSGAFVGTDYCNASTNLAIRTNVEGTQNIVEIANKFNIKLAYLSTTAIFDTNDYSEYKLITEQTKINPKTLYGITKYAGEQIVEKTCKTDKLIIRPVFGYSNYPDDLHSALTKFIYVKLYNLIKNPIMPLKLNILLNKNIEKTYTHVKNLAYLIFKILKLNYWNDAFNIGDNVENSANWYQLNSIINNLVYNKLNIKLSDDDFSDVNFIENEDYLHWHNISTIKLQRMGLFNNFNNNYISLENGIEQVIDSVIKNIDQIPYWI
jgi:dTDP-4-dehydrorhamnose reductase